MKKILVLLVSVLSTLSVFGQSRLDYTAVNTPTNVGDTLVVKFQYFKDAALGESTLNQFDFQYNNKLLQYISHEWQVVSTSAQTARNNWNGYKFTIDSNKGQTDFDGQYMSWLGNTATYGTNADWSVERITVQDVTGYPTEAEFIKYSFKIKDKGLTNYSDYSDVINANWANYKESDGTQIDVTGQSSLSLSNIQGGDAGNVAINVFSNVISNNIGDGTDFGYTIYTRADFDNGVDQNTPVVASGNFDAAGQAVVTGLENDTEYHISVYIDSQAAYLDNAVTVSDLALIFQEAIGAGGSPNGSTTTFDYYLQKLLGNVTDFPNGVNFQDSYEVLAHLQGVATNNQNVITKTGQAYNVSGIKSTFGDDNGNGSPSLFGYFTPTNNNKSFDVAHALAGDVNFSHGFEPTSGNAAIPTQAVSAISMARAMRISGEKFRPESANLDLVSEIVDGKVIFTIGSDVEGMVGSQFNIVYDNTRLVLDNVVFDTGNDMTNFSNHIENEGKIRVGSFDQNFSSTVKVGTPYKLIFTPMVELQNTSGLISFKVKEGVKADGTQINFIME